MELANPAVRDAFLAELKQALTPMQKLDCPAMIVLSGNVFPGLSREQQHQSCIEGLKRAAELIEGKQIDGQPMRLLLECIDPEENPHYFLQSAAEAIDIVRAVNHPQVQFLYDLFHEQIAEGNLIEKLEKHIDVIGLIHVADVPGRHQPGTGEINYANIYRKLAELHYRARYRHGVSPHRRPGLYTPRGKADGFERHSRVLSQDHGARSKRLFTWSGVMLFGIAKTEGSIVLFNSTFFTAIVNANCPKSTSMA